MKIRVIIIAVAVLSSFILAKETLNSESKIDIIGEAFNTDNKPVVAVTYGIANNPYVSIPEAANYIKPEMVMQIADQLKHPGPGPLEATDEIPTIRDYYDGGIRLNKIDVKCKIYANPTDCVHQSGCGWCGSSNSCITGNNVGPLEPCVKGAYIFSPPLPNWQPQTQIINDNVGGVKMTVINRP